MTDGQSRPRKPNLFARVMSSVTSTPEMVAWPHTIRRLVERQSGLEYPCARTSGRKEACFLTLSERRTARTSEAVQKATGTRAVGGPFVPDTRIPTASGLGCRRQEKTARNWLRGER